MEPAGHEDVPIRQVVPAMRGLLIVSGVLVVGAGNALFLLSERTDEYFAWTIGNPLVAAFLGAAFYASCALEILSAAERSWARARLGVPAVLTFTVLTLIATLLHLDVFHDGWIAWAWIAIYAVVPPAYLTVIWLQLRADGVDEPRRFRLPGWIRAAAAGLGGVMIFVGEGLMVAPADAADLWPWPLTELAARATGAWLIGLGVIAVHAAWENDYLRLRGASVAAILLAVLQGIALARYPETVDFGSAEAIGYLLALAAVGGGGVAGLLGNRRALRSLSIADGASAHPH
jgi:hypothetical protein